MLTDEQQAAAALGVKFYLVCDLEIQEVLLVREGAPRNVVICKLPPDMKQEVMRCDQPFFELDDVLMEIRMAFNLHPLAYRIC